MSSTTESWGSRIGIVLAMAGNAVGFGNFLRFPIQAIENGGGAFIIPYIVCFLLLGIPLMFIEWTIGRFGGQFGEHSPPYILQSMGKKRGWRYIGVFGLFSTLAIASYYCYLESWTLSYIYHSLVGTFRDMNQTGVAQVFSNYHNMSNTQSGIPYENVIVFIICLALNIWILSRGLKGGIEKVAKLGVPLLIILGIFLAVKGVMIKPGDSGAISYGIEGLNFLWTPQFSSLLDPKVWLAAAGQIFFTLSLGMGCIQCYSSYMKHSEDVALGALSTSFLNEFVEIVLGGTIILSISVGFFGLDTMIAMVGNEGGFGMAFQTMPFLFSKWHPVMGTICGVAFFGLLFIAGITSSLAMCTPTHAFLKDEFNIEKNRAAIIIGVVLLMWGLPTVLFYTKGVFDEYDYWAGTVSLFFFAMMECILFSWVFGAKKGWKELNYAADIKIPVFFKFILKFITPTLLILIFVSALIKPKNDDWSLISIKGWEVDNSSLIGKMMNKDVGVNSKWISDTLYVEEKGVYKGIADYGGAIYMEFSCLDMDEKEYGYIKRYPIKKNQYPISLNEGEIVEIGSPIMSGKFFNDVFFTSMARYYLILLFTLLLIMVSIASRKRERNSLKP